MRGCSNLALSRVLIQTLGHHSHSWLVDSLWILFEFQGHQITMGAGLRPVQVQVLIPFSYTVTLIRKNLCELFCTHRWWDTKTSDTSTCSQARARATVCKKTWISLCIRSSDTTRINIKNTLISGNGVGRHHLDGVSDAQTDSDPVRCLLTVATDGKTDRYSS